MKTGKNLGKKLKFFKIFASNLKKNFDEKYPIILKNCPIKLKFGQNVARVSLNNFTRAFFYILMTFQLMGFRIEQNGYFGQFLTKISVLFDSRPHKLENNQNIEQARVNLLGYSSNLSAKFQLNWTIFFMRKINFRQSFFSKFYAKILKNVFFAQIFANFQYFSEIF